MKRVLDKYKKNLKNRKYLKSLIVAVIFLLASIVVTFYAIIYATDRASNAVTDIVLSNIPVFDLDGLFVYGPIVFWAIIGFYMVFIEPKKIPFTLKSIALFLIIRSVAMTLTHIGPYPAHAQINLTGLIGVFTTGSDLFFSSHAGLPFLMALVFWKDKLIRNFSIFSSIFFGIVVLLAHLHYTIDVFAAFFITYTIFKISESLFKHDRHVFMNGVEENSNV